MINVFDPVINEEDYYRLIGVPVNVDQLVFARIFYSIRLPHDSFRFGDTHSSAKPGRILYRFRLCTGAKKQHYRAHCG